MKHFYTLLITAGFLLSGFSMKAQVGISDSSSLPAPSAMLDVKSTTKGVLLPRMTMAERNGITTPDDGLLIFQTDNTPGFYYYNGSSWQAVSRNPQAQHQLFSSVGSYTFSTSANITAQTVFKATITAGGGSGGYYPFGYYVSGGGGGGQTIISWVSGLAPSTDYTVQIGIGGFDIGYGGNGGNSSFSGITATGGSGGGYTTLSSATTPGGAGGSSAVPAGSISIAGGTGFAGTSSSTYIKNAGNGGDSYYGAGGAGASMNTTIYTLPATAQAWGSGGGGGCNTPYVSYPYPAPGQGGAVLIEWTE